jgi:hypothetical protein
MTEPVTYPDVRETLANLPHPPTQAMRYALDTDIFVVRHEIIRALDPPPRSVFEFGALYGFFLVTALDAAPSIGRVGWVDNESHTPGSNQKCLENVLSVRPDVELITAATADLMHVDGDHSFAGCLADLRTAALLGTRTLMVDDWTAELHRADIRSAVDEWLWEEPASWRLDVYETANGLAVLTKQA